MSGAEVQWLFGHEADNLDLVGAFAKARAALDNAAEPSAFGSFFENAARVASDRTTAITGAVKQCNDLNMADMKHLPRSDEYTLPFWLMVLNRTGETLEVDEFHLQNSPAALITEEPLTAVPAEFDDGASVGLWSAAGSNVALMPISGPGFALKFKPNSALGTGNLYIGIDRSAGLGSSTDSVSMMLGDYGSAKLFYTSQLAHRSSPDFGRHEAHVGNSGIVGVSAECRLTMGRSINKEFSTDDGDWLAIATIRRGKA